MTKKIHKLSLEPEYNFQLIGISSHENDYRLSWAINQALKIQLVKVTGLEIMNRKFSEKQIFSLYTYEDDDTLIKYNLLSNTCENGFLVEELKNIDFFIQIFGTVTRTFINNLNDRLKNIDIITASFVLNPDQLKSKAKLLY